MPPEVINMMGPMGGGGMAGAVVYAVIKLIELKAGIPKLQADLDAVRKMHEACEVNVRALQAQVTQLIAQIASGRSNSLEP
jgi:hypothetical protein